MTQSSHEKVLAQIQKKPGKYQKYLKHNTPRQRKFGKSVKKCTLTGATRGVIHKYGLQVCRKSFREIALELGFKKYN